ncbi:hypothetical protein ACFQE5_18830 [Pseudonocardia hispaniensis]|uniref:Uncharacterized protein n=1 Tax=Pseudonocardia hispaniensis TaxID=904933 RepID=A0ABW1J755_9PSEU
MTTETTERHNPLTCENGDSITSYLYDRTTESPHIAAGQRVLSFCRFCREGRDKAMPPSSSTIEAVLAEHRQDGPGRPTERYEIHPNHLKVDTRTGRGPAVAGSFSRSHNAARDHLFLVAHHTNGA